MLIHAQVVPVKPPFDYQNVCTYIATIWDNILFYFLNYIGTTDALIAGIAAGIVFPLILLIALCIVIAIIVVMCCKSRKAKAQYDAEIRERQRRRPQHRPQRRQQAQIRQTGVSISACVLMPSLLLQMLLDSKWVPFLYGNMIVELNSPHPPFSVKHFYIHTVCTCILSTIICRHICMHTGDRYTVNVILV